MLHNFLHNLDQLAQSASVCLLGKRGRNSRFRKILHRLRPDVEIVTQIDTEEAGLFRSPDFPDKENIRKCDLILITLTKYKQLCVFLRTRNIRHYLIVNPNFYHPFMQFEAGDGEHVRKLLEAKTLFPPEDGKFYDLILASVQPRSDLEEIYHNLVGFYGRMGRQYFDFINTSEIRTVIEGGVADGLNTVEFFEQFSHPLIYGFEPDTELFQHSYFSPFLENNPKIRIFPFALWHKAERLGFRLRHAGASQVCSEPDSGKGESIEAVSIDEFVNDHRIEKVDFIKLDIEGADFNAVQGAQKTLRAHRPQLAVCIYHLLEHRYQIPLFLRENTKDYVFRIGHYSPLHVFSETVLYAIPKELCPFP